MNENKLLLIIVLVLIVATNKILLQEFEKSVKQNYILKIIHILLTTFKW